MTDFQSILKNLQTSPFRAKFHLTKRDVEYIKEKGMEKIKSHAYDFISSRLAPAFPKNDGKQTPLRGHPVFIAQHATATCCRSCLQKWHKIEKDKPLSDNQIEFVVNLIMFWIQQDLQRI